MKRVKSWKKNICIFIGTEAFSIQLSPIHLGRLIQVYTGSSVFCFFFCSLDFQTCSTFLDLPQKIRFISHTCAMLAVCLCSWGTAHLPSCALWSPSLQCQQPLPSPGVRGILSFIHRGKASYVQKGMQTAHRPSKMSVPVQGRPVISQYECIILFIGSLIITKLLFLY